jgi:hypothetical protein
MVRLETLKYGHKPHKTLDTKTDRQTVTCDLDLESDPSHFTLKMEAELSSEALSSYQINAWLHNPENMTSEVNFSSQP